LRIGGTEVIDSSRVLKNIASVNQSLLPTSDNAHDLGSSSFRWRNAFVGGGPVGLGNVFGRIGSFDTRDDNYLPEQYYRGVVAEFKRNSVIGISGEGTYSGLLTYRQWGYGTDWSGGGVHQIAFGSGGGLWHRYSQTTGSWGAWERILTSFKAIPDVDNARDLGSSSLRWRDGHLAGNLNVGGYGNLGSLRIGGTEVIDSSRNLKNIASALISGNLEVGGFLFTNDGAVANPSTSEVMRVGLGTTGFAKNGAWIECFGKDYSGREGELALGCGGGSSIGVIKFKWYDGTDWHDIATLHRTGDFDITGNLNVGGTGTFNGGLVVYPSGNTIEIRKEADAWCGVDICAGSTSLQTRTVRFIDLVNNTRWEVKAEYTNKLHFSYYDGTTLSDLVKIDTGGNLEISKGWLHIRNSYGIMLPKDSGVDAKIVPGQAGHSFVGTSTGYFYAMHAVSFVNHSPDWVEEDVLSKIKNIRGKNRKLDKHSLPENVKHYPDPREGKIKGEITDDMIGVNLGNAVSLCLKAIQQLLDKVENLENRVNQIASQK